jgi:hypothetical protein
VTNFKFRIKKYSHSKKHQKLSKKEQQQQNAHLELDNAQVIKMTAFFRCYSSHLLFDIILLKKSNNTLLATILPPSIEGGNIL